MRYIIYRYMVFACVVVYSCLRSLHKIKYILHRAWVDQ